MRGSRGCSHRCRAAVAATLAAALVLPSRARPLPDKNELANSCYFTYRVGYVICDSNLPPELAKEQMEAGKCNEDFRLTASDFQRRVVRHYEHGDRPPLEEATWLLSSPENFQTRTLRECPPMQIIAYMLLAEAKLFVHGPNPTTIAFELASRALQQVREMPDDVISALARAWPIEQSMDRFQDRVLELRERIQMRESAPDTYELQYIVCRCAEQLAWLGSLAPPLHVSSRLIVYESCAGQGTWTDQSSQELAAFSTVEVRPVSPDAAGLRGECGPSAILQHFAELAAAASEGGGPTHVAVLPAAEPEGPELNLLRLVAASLGQRTLGESPGFLPLGLRRTHDTGGSQALGERCRRAVRAAALGPGFPQGYEGARFVVSRGRFGNEKSAQHFQRLLGVLGAPPPACDGEEPAVLGDVFTPAWHMVFGEAPRLPIRADDSRTPLFVRFEDGPSGFQGSRLPKRSTYLLSSASWVAAQ